MKICSLCKENKNRWDFYNRKGGIDGLSHHCKICSNERHEKWAIKNRKRLLKNYADYRKKNITRIREYDRRRYRNNLERREDALRRSRAWKHANPRLKKDKDLKRRFGITLKDYENIFESQKGVCVICNKPETLIRQNSKCGLAIDHCHISGKIRGLLCNNCNRILGMLKEDVFILKNMISYLKKHGK